MAPKSPPNPLPVAPTVDEALRASEAKLRTVVEHIPQKIFVKDRDSRYLFVNGNYARDLGLTPEAAIGKLDTEFFSKDLAEKYQADDRRIIETGRTEEFEEEYLQDGKRIWIQIIKAPVRAKDGAILGICGIFRDISERRESQISLRRRGEILAAVCFAAQRFLHHSHWRSSIAEVLERLGRAADVSRAVLFDATPSDEGGTISGLVAEWTASPSLRRTGDPSVHNLPLIPAGFGRWVTTLAQGQVIQGHVREFPASERSPLARHGILSIVAVPVTAGGHWWGFLAFDQCDHERVWKGEEIESLRAAANILGEAMYRERAEESFARVTRLQNLVLDAAGEGILGLDTEGRHTFVNPAATRMLGFEAGELIGVPSHSTWHHARSNRPPPSGDPCPICLTLHDSRTHRKGNATFWRKDGTGFPVEYVSTPILENGVHVGTVVAFDDITARRQLEAQLRQSQKLEAIGQLAGGVAHDFNNILAATFLNLDLLRQTRDDGDESRRCLEELESDLRRAANLTRQLLLFGRRSVIQIRPVNLDHVVENLLKMLRRIIGETTILDWRCSSPLPPVSADVGMLEQVIVNLVVNARDAMPAGGRITLETRTLTLAPDSPRPHPDALPGDYIRLSVADTGMGMSREVMDRLFEPFFTTKEPGKGTGLGLATVYSIARQHRGWVTVESEIGKGSQFHVFLPALPPEAQPATAHPPSARSSPKGTEVILLVEDEASLRRSVAGFLRLYGYHVIEAPDGPSAVSLWEQHRDQVDLLFTDMVMPHGMNGLQLAQTLRASRPDLKVILASGYCADLAQETDFAIQRITFVSKPCDPHALTVLVRTTLDQPAAAPPSDSAPAAHPRPDPSRPLDVPTPR